MKMRMYRLGLIIGMVLSCTLLQSCIHGKYDDSDIRDMIAANTQAIQTNQARIDAIISTINAGGLITKVVPFTDDAGGLDVFVSNRLEPIRLYNGKKGATGATGATGQKADIWTIGTDGYWYKNREKTNYPAKGADGATGTTGAAGEKGEKGDKGDDSSVNGTNGTDGGYYVAHADGTFHLFVNGADTGATDIKWASQCLSAVINDQGELILSGIDGDVNNKVTIPMAKLYGITINEASILEKKDGVPVAYFALPTNTDGSIVNTTGSMYSGTVQLATNPINACLTDLYDKISIKDKNLTTRATEPKFSCSVKNYSNGILTLELQCANNYLSVKEPHFFCVEIKLDDNTVITSGYIRAEPINGFAFANGVGSVEWVQLWAGGPKFARTQDVVSGTTKLWNFGQVANDREYYDNYLGTDFDANNNLKKQYDTATAFWGEDWRMPTMAELEPLCKRDITDFRFIDNEASKYAQFNGKGTFERNFLNLIPWESAVYSATYFSSSCTQGKIHSINFTKSNVVTWHTDQTYSMNRFSIRAVLR